MIQSYLKSHGIGLGILLGILVTAILTVQRYMSLPPNNGENMALAGLIPQCILYGVPVGGVVGLALAKVGEKLPRKQGTPGTKSTQKKMALGLGGLGILLLGTFLLYGHENTNRLATMLPRITRTAQKQGFLALWDRKQPNLLVIDLVPHGYARVDDSDNATWYYLAFCHARRAAGYSVVSSLQCTVELRLLGTVVKRKSLLNEASSE